MNKYEIYDINGKLIKCINTDVIVIKENHWYLANEIDSCYNEPVAVIGINHTVA
mgnify:CR=1 FL=1